MIALRVCLFLLALGLASSELIKISESEKSLTTSTSVAPEDDKNNPAKRDSSDQTASHNGKAKEEPFKPMYSVPYQEQPFRPTTIRYAVAGAAPQAYYEKLDRTGGIQYAAPIRSQSVSPSGGILYASPNAAKSSKEAPQYASSVYRGPLNPNYQQAGHAGAAPQYVRAPPPTVAVPPPPQQKHQTSQIFLASDPETEFMYGQIQQQPPPQITALPHPRPHSPPPPPPPQPRQQQKQIQYVIAIPVEYMRQLQQHLAEEPLHAAPVHALSTHAPESPGKTYQGIYKNLHYAAASPTEPTAPPTSPTYMTQYIQVPESLLQSLGAPLYQKPQYQQTYYPQHQPVALHQRQQHHQQQQQQQQNAVYAYPFHQQQEQEQQQHHQLEQQHQPQQHQTQQQQHQQPIVRIGVAKASSSQVTAAHHHTAPSSSGPPQSPSFIHYKPIYVQQQQQQGQLQLPMSFAHYHQHHLATSPYFIRQPYMPAAAGNIYPQVDSSLQQGIVARMSFGYPYPPLQQEAAELPYFSHPGAIHYGTHLFHPPAPAASNQVLGPVATAATHQLHQQQQQHQQQQHQQQLPQQHQQQQQQQQQHPPAAGSHSASRAPGAGLVKYP